MRSYRQQLSNPALSRAARDQIADTLAHLEDEYGAAPRVSATTKLDRYVGAETSDTYPVPTIRFNATLANGMAARPLNTPAPGPDGVVTSTTEGDFSLPDLPSLVAHEYFHVLQYSLGVEQAWDFGAELAQDTWKTLGHVRDDVSHYATSSPIEFGAELFSLTHGARHYGNTASLPTRTQRAGAKLERWAQLVGNTLRTSTVTHIKEATQ
jgi:hypothetical protein